MKRRPAPSDATRERGRDLKDLPLAVVRLCLHPFFPSEHDWADFFFLLSFFVMGYVLFADKRFTQAVRRDWPIMLAVGSTAFLAAVGYHLRNGGVGYRSRTSHTIGLHLVGSCHRLQLVLGRRDAVRRYALSGFQQ